MTPATPDLVDLTDHLNMCEGCPECAARAWCETCQQETIPLRDLCHECNQPISRTRPADRLEET